MIEMMNMIKEPQSLKLAITDITQITSITVQTIDGMDEIIDELNKELVA